MYFILKVVFVSHKNAQQSGDLFLEDVVEAIVKIISLIKKGLLNW